MHNLSVHERRDIIFQRFYDRFDIMPHQVTDSIERSHMLSQVLEEFLPDYLENKQDDTHLLNQQFTEFGNNILPLLQYVMQETLNNNKNIYQLFNCPSLAASNAITRTFNTKLGLFWEDIAILSSNVVSTELEFGFKLVGVDSILYHDNSYIYCQLKTQKNTLTGSQVHRVIDELSPYDNALVVSCLHCNTNWTYSGSIPRIVGEDFWNMTDLIYDDILENLNQLLLRVEDLLN